MPRTLSSRSNASLVEEAARGGIPPLLHAPLSPPPHSIHRPSGCVGREETPPIWRSKAKVGKINNTRPEMPCVNTKAQESKAPWEKT